VKVLVELLLGAPAVGVKDSASSSPVTVIIAEPDRV
jgi:hypothetical protein